tara:strand:- start:1520 stop:2296 length:777 start_codon:yes stop_codon:yes gene_type:complete
MRPLNYIAFFLSLFLFGIAAAQSQEANVSLYVIDHSDEYSALGGACFKYTPEIKPGKDREILAIANGPPGSTVIMIAFQQDNLFRNLPPVVSVQSLTSSPLRFPAQQSEARWAYNETNNNVELYIVALEKDDPQLERLTEYAAWLTDSLGENDEETAMLHALAIKNRLANLHRSNNAEVQTISFPPGERTEPTAKAATTRGGLSQLGKPNTETKPTTETPLRGLKNIDAEWEEDSQPIRFGPEKPGILIFPITTRTTN